MKGNSKWQVMPSVIAALFVALAFVGCKPGVPHQYIQPDELEEILYDYHLADGMLASRPAGDKADQTVAYHAAVLKKHHVTQAEFDSSMVYYMRNAEVLHGIYEKLGERMQKEVGNLPLWPVSIQPRAIRQASGTNRRLWFFLLRCLSTTGRSASKWTQRFTRVTCCC